MSPIDEIFEEYNNNWDNIINNYFNSITYFKKEHAVYSPCTVCGNHQPLNKEEIKGIFDHYINEKPDPNNNYEKFWEMGEEPFCIFNKYCSKCFHIGAAITDGEIFCMFDIIYKYHNEYKKYIQNIKNMILLGRMSPNSPFYNEYMPRDIFKIIWLYVKN